MNKTFKIAILITLGLALFYSDFIRDYIFKNLEYQIHYLSHFSADGFPTVENFTDSSMREFLDGKSINSISNLKWIFTFVFTVYFLIFSTSYIKRKLLLNMPLFYMELFFPQH